MRENAKRSMEIPPKVKISKVEDGEGGDRPPVASTWTRAVGILGEGFLLQHFDVLKLVAADSGSFTSNPLFHSWPSPTTSLRSFKTNGSLRPVVPSRFQITLLVFIVQPPLGAVAATPHPGPG